MDDRTIKAMLLSRNEQALELLDREYGKLCRKIALNILGNPLDAEECVNDAYLAVWTHVPPVDPDPLRSYLLKTVRNAAIQRYRTESAKKRNRRFDIPLNELEETLFSCTNVEEEVLKKELFLEIEAFLKALPTENRVLFVRRYWYSESVSDLAKDFGISEHNVVVKLARIRKKLKDYLDDRMD